MSKIISSLDYLGSIQVQSAKSNIVVFSLAVIVSITQCYISLQKNRKSKCILDRGHLLHCGTGGLVVHALCL